MESFGALCSEVLRRYLWMLIIRWPTDDAGSLKQAERVFEQLTTRDASELARHIETYLILAASGLLQDYEDFRSRGDLRRTPTKRSHLEDRVPTQREVRACELRAARLRQRLNTEVDPISRAAVVLVHRRLSFTHVAQRLGLSVSEVRARIAQCIRQLTCGDSQGCHETLGAEPKV